MMDRPVQTFAVGFAEAGEGNELADARFVAETLGADHHELELSFAQETIAARASSSGISTSRSPTSPRSAFIALSGLAARARDRRALGPGSGRAARRLPQAPRSVARRDMAAAACAGAEGTLAAAVARSRAPAAAGRTRSRPPGPPSGCSR